MLQVGSAIRSPIHYNNFFFGIGKSLYLWSMKFVQEGPAYELWLEGAHEINTSFEEKVEQLPKAITFFWMMKASINNRYVS